MKANIVTRITINAPAADVFRYLTDMKYIYLWNPQIRHVSSQEKLTLHSTYKTESEVLGMKIKAANTVTKCVPDKELQIENTTGLVGYRANFKITEQSSHQIILVCSTTVSSDSKAFVFTTPILKALARRELQTDLQALKVAVEHKVEPPSNR